MARPAKPSEMFNHVTDAAPEYVDVILWHRVVLAVAALALLVSGLGYTLFRLTATEQETAPVTSVTLDELTKQEAPAAIPQASAAQISAEEETDADPLTFSEQISQPAESEEASASTADSALQALADSVTDNLQLEDNADATPLSPEDVRYQVQTTILVPSVKRAMITEKMRGLEPGKPVTDTRALNAQSPFSLYQFVDIRGQAGDTLIYHWKRNGKTVAKVRVPVGSDKWRNHSSKNFNQNLLGEWQVDVTNQHDMLLVRSEFYLGE